MEGCTCWKGKGPAGGKCCPHELCCRFQRCKGPTSGCFVPVESFLFALPGVFTWLPRTWDLPFKQRSGVSRGSGLETGYPQRKLRSSLLFVLAREAVGTQRIWGWARLVIFYALFVLLAYFFVVAQHSLMASAACPLPRICCGQLGFFGTSYQ